MKIMVFSIQNKKAHLVLIDLKTICIYIYIYLEYYNIRYIQILYLI